MNKQTSREFFEVLNQSCYVRKTSLLFHNSRLERDKKYRKGLLEVFEWIDELSYYYLKKEKRLKKDFLEKFNSAYRKANTIQESSYKEGLLHSFHEIQEIIEGKY